MNVTLRDIKEKLGTYKYLSHKQTIEFRKKWKKSFVKKNLKAPMHRCSHCKGFVNDEAYGFDWHGISYAGFDNCHDYLNAIGKEAIFNKEEVVVFEEDCAKKGIRILYSDIEKFLKKNKNKHYIDIYFTPKDFAWTVVLTHEDGYIGPFFVKAEMIK